MFLRLVPVVVLGGGSLRVCVGFPGVAEGGLGLVPGGVWEAGLPIAAQLGLDLLPGAALVLRIVVCLPAVAVVRLVVFPAAGRALAAAIALLPGGAVAGGYVVPAGRGALGAGG